MIFLLISSYADSLLNFRGPLIAAIQAKGLKVHVAAPGLSADPALLLQLESMGISAHDIPMQRTGTNPYQDLKTLIHLYRLMQKIQPNYVLGYFIKPVIYGSLAAAMAGVPHRFALIAGLGYTFQHHEETGSEKATLLASKLIPLLYKMGLCTVEKVFFQNPDDEALFRQLKILPPSVPSIIVNGSGIDTSKFSLTPLPGNNGKNDPNFLLIARLLAAKGTKIYAEAARIIKKQYPQAKLRLVGWIDENPDSIQQSELDSWINEGIIEYLGKLSDVRPAISDSLVFVLPSYYREGTPRTVLEAMSMGRPIITTDAPGCRETVIDGENGFLIPVKSVDALVNAMKQFIENPELAHQMGAKSRAIAEEKYDVNKVNTIMLSEMGIDHQKS